MFAYKACFPGAKKIVKLTYLIQKFVDIFHLTTDSWIITSKASNGIHVIVCD